MKSDDEIKKETGQALSVHLCYSSFKNHVDEHDNTFKVLFGMAKLIQSDAFAAGVEKGKRDSAAVCYRLTINTKNTDEYNGLFRAEHAILATLNNTGEKTK